MKTYRVSLAAVALVLCFAATSRASIKNSAHDFSKLAWAKNQVCLPCHTPHNADITVTNAPLWNHTLTNASYTMYGGSAGTAAADLDGTSRLCMSCHDGTVAPDSFGGGAATATMSGGLLGTDLRANHPIGSSAVYPSSGTSMAAKSYFDPATVLTGMRLQPLTISGTSQLVVSCISCHDPHNKPANDHMTWVSQTGSFTTVDGRTVPGSGLCLNCHKK